jgi:nucleosome-remodeling factor subunit BPTF
MPGLVAAGTPVSTTTLHASVSKLQPSDPSTPSVPIAATATQTSTPQLQQVLQQLTPNTPAGGAIAPQTPVTTPAGTPRVVMPTAQVVQTPQGPSIILQGLRGNFTEQQLAMLKEQVKQQVLKGNNYCWKATHFNSTVLIVHNLQLEMTIIQ